MKNKRSLLEWSLFLPILGIALLMLQSGMNARDGQSFRVPIEGFDPRDLIHGHYINFRYDLSSTEKVRDELPDGAILCLNREGKSVRMSAGLAGRLAHAECAARIPVSKLLGAQRYLIPEADARALEAQLRNGETQASVDLIIQDNGDTSLGMLYFDDRPWREVLGKAANTEN